LKPVIDFLHSGRKECVCEGEDAPLRARVVVVHNDPEFAAQVAATLTRAGHDVAVFADPMVALDALDTAQHVEVLVTQIRFAPAKPNGIALARMALIRRPWIKVLFTARPEFAEHAAGLGEFIAMPACVTDVAAAVDGLLLAAELEVRAASGRPRHDRLQRARPAPDPALANK
jgi:DNA-binding NtrC family response regulator